jgi:hypothetical protein
LIKVTKLPDSYDDQQKSIRSITGLTTLMDLKQIKGFKFTDQQIVHVFSNLSQFVLLMNEQGFCYSNLKLENITLMPVGGNNYVAKVILFNSELTRNQSVIPKNIKAGYANKDLRDL